MELKTYAEKILAFLSETTEPTDVEKIRIACGIGNWNTALKHCLELLVQDKIMGQKTSKSWVFWKRGEDNVHPNARESLGRSRSARYGRCFDH